MKAHVVDGTYELFRHYHGAPPHENAAREEVGATRAVLGSLLGMLEGGATHIGVATDHVIESWRNEEWPTYKSSAGVPADLLSQFSLFEEALELMGIVVWPMTDLEADDALASAAEVLSEDDRLSQVLICTPDKDLGQCVRGSRVVCLDRRKGVIIDEVAVRERFGVGPSPCPTGSGSLGTVRTGSRACPVGAQKPPALCSAVTARSRLSRPWPRPGRWTCLRPARPVWLRPSKRTTSGRCFSRSWRPAS